MENINREKLIKLISLYVVTTIFKTCLMYISDNHITKADMKNIIAYGSSPMFKWSRTFQADHMFEFNVVQDLFGKRVVEYISFYINNIYLIFGIKIKKLEVERYIRKHYCNIISFTNHFFFNEYTNGCKLRKITAVKTYTPIVLDVD